MSLYTVWRKILMKEQIGARKIFTNLTIWIILTCKELLEENLDELVKFEFIYFCSSVLMLVMQTRSNMLGL